VAEIAKNALKRFTKLRSQINAPISRTKAKNVASLGVIAPVTKGRLLVLFIFLSISASSTMLNELAPAAASEPPTMVAIMSHKEGVPSSATNMVGTVVINNVRIIAGFVNTKKEFIRKRIESGL
jgi:hypothetical protein